MAKMVTTICLKTYVVETVKPILWFTIVINICPKCFRRIEQGKSATIYQQNKNACWTPVPDMRLNNILYYISVLPTNR